MRDYNEKFRKKTKNKSPSPPLASCLAAGTLQSHIFQRGDYEVAGETQNHLSLWGEE
jgi:hypothetical protein